MTDSTECYEHIKEYEQYQSDLGFAEWLDNGGLND